MKEFSIIIGLILSSIVVGQNKNIYFGGGCFWCVEVVFDDLKGVEEAESGYAGGRTWNPTYKEISYGDTGHAEVVKVTYDPSVISLDQLLEVFWYMHDPTTLNRQGADIGTQYRSIVLYEEDKEKEIIEKSKAKWEQSGIWDGNYTTEITKLKKYYPAEEYHQNYYQNNTSQPYCSYTIAPKIEKFRKRFKNWLK
ncbi:peptide-methionine (S)-S-oxide reductase [Flavobacteriaceae bacterium UJ101]|nr:peptide-methionine (S)-S-oxide reductase [Flavobacteriaceae bacterium UJ101]